MHSSEQAAAGDGVPARGYYSISEAAALLGVSRVSIWRWIRAGLLPAARLGHRTARIKREDLERAVVQIGPGGSRAWVVRNLRADAAAKPDAGSNDVPRWDGTLLQANEHFVQFYDSDAFLLDSVSDYIGSALGAGETGIVVATEAHCEGVEGRLQAAGLNVAAARARGQYLALDAIETLAKFMVDGAPDEERFIDVLGSIIARAAPGRRVRIFGEMVALLLVDGEGAAMRLEELWNGLQRTHSFSLFCAYPMPHFAGEAPAELLGKVCGEHSSVIPAESYTALASVDGRLRAVAQLQQKAEWLQVEIVERRNVEERLRVALASERAAREAAEDALRLRDEFLSIAAHELRTPLTSLLGYAQMVPRWLKQDGRLEPERVVPALEAITGQAGKLSSLIYQLLDVSRLEAGKLTLAPQLTDLGVLVRQAVSGVQASRSERAILVDAPAAVEVEVDPLRLEQVLANLLDNAIKYSPEGRPIEVAVARLDAASVQLSVRDHGPGIPPEKRGQIFERFYQANRDGYKNGMGLGLYISRQIVELHDGEIGAEFPLEGGTRFLVRLPIRLAKPPAAQAPAAG